MIKRTTQLVAVLLILLTLGTPLVQAEETTEENCGRECLGGFIDRYLDAMLAHDPHSLAVAPHLKFTEDCIEMQLGEGLWKGITKVTDYRMDILDVREGVAISHLVVETNGAPAMFALRLQITANKISEVETMVVRNKEEGMIFKPEALVAVSTAMTRFPDPGQLDSREEMMTMARLYPAGLKTGSFVTVNVPFTPATYRFENGQLMAGPGCSFFPGCEDIKNQRIPTLSGITHKVAAVDEELGIVLLRMNFGPGSTFDGNNELNVWEAFKIYGGQIHAVEAFMEVIPQGTPSGWD